MTVRIRYALIYSLLTAQLTGCAVGPDYVRPEAQVPGEFKEAKGWKQNQPRDNVLTGKWWKIFNDARLNELEKQVATANQSIIQAGAQYRQAQDLVQSAQSGFFPVLLPNPDQAGGEVKWTDYLIFPVA
ncbi:MAG: hypothetical protein ACXWFI_02420 [Methylobacter sp.]